MFDRLPPARTDSLMQLGLLMQADPRADKIDLGVGVYKDAQGRTPVMRAVKAAEQKIWETQTSKTYTALAGEPEYRDAMASLVLGDLAKGRVASVGTVGGTGAIRQALELVRMANPDAVIHVSDPTWPNHLSIMNFMGQAYEMYPYFDNATRGVAFDAMLDGLKRAKKGDVVLLHGCCHNPTGANPTAEQWDAIAEVLEQTGAIPLIDLAYQGFGDGLEEDAAATRMIALRLPEVLIAASCSKNFGIYRERTGILMTLTSDNKAR